MALQSGGVKGFCHIATLTLLEEYGAEPDVIAGSSFGAVVGALYALEMRASAVYGKLIEAVKKNLTSQGRPRGRSISPWVGLKMLFSESLFELEETYKMLRELFGRTKFSQLRKKVLVVSFDLESRSSIVHEEGYVVDALLASCSVPGIFQPVYLAGSKQLDGGVLSPVPVSELRVFGAETVVASTFLTKPRRPKDQEELLSLVDSIHEAQIVENQLARADYTFRYELDVEWSDFDKCERVFAESIRRVREVQDDFERFLRGRFKSLRR